MAAWTGAAPAEAAELFALYYPLLWTRRQSEIAGRLDVVAHLTITSSSAFSAAQRPLAIAHMVAHQLESSPSDGTAARAGGPLTARANERGSQSYQTASPGQYFGVAEYLLQGTEGGRNLLAMMVSLPTVAAYSP